MPATRGWSGHCLTAENSPTPDECHDRCARTGGCAACDCHDGDHPVYTPEPTRPDSTSELVSGEQNEVGSSRRRTRFTEAPPTTTQEGHNMATSTKEKAADTDRRGKGDLEALILEVTEDYEAGNITLEDGKTLTPTRIANLIGEKDGEDKPSAGAVAAALKRWEECGYALTYDKPYAFKRTSAAGKKSSLADLKEKAREKRRAEKRAEREAAKAESSDSE